MSTSLHRGGIRAALGALIVALLVAVIVGIPQPATAHVDVAATDTTAGAYTRITFAVPTESDSESTVRVEVALPTDTPFTSVRTVRLAGWTAELVTEDLPEPVESAHGTEITEAVTRVVWTANTPGDGIRPDETGLFVLAVGPLPGPGEVFLPALQVYDSGREVHWSQQASGSAEPEHPAPRIVVSAADDEATDAATAAASGAEAAAAAGDDPASPWFVVTGIAAVAALGIALAALAITLRRRSPAA